jgi:lambda family phage portal protein
MGPGQINIMEPGESVDFADPKRPAGGFDAFVTAVSSQIGAALEIPADLLLKKFNASYSASRAALLEAWKGFRMRRNWLTDDFCKPIYEIWLTEAVARGRISAPGFLTDPIIRQAYLESEWIGPSQGMIYPVKELTASKMAIDEGLSTRSFEAVKLNGSEYESNAERLVAENEQLRKANGVNSNSAPTSNPIFEDDDDGDDGDEQ